MSLSIFCNGCFLSPRMVVTSEGTKAMWVVVSFEDDCYLDGVLVDVNNVAKDCEGLVNKVESDEWLQVSKVVVDGKEI